MPVMVWMQYNWSDISLAHIHCHESSESTWWWILYVNVNPSAVFSGYKGRCVYFTRRIDICCSWYPTELNRGSIHRFNLSVNADSFPSVIPVNNVWPHVKNRNTKAESVALTHCLGSYSHQVQSHIKGKDYVSPSSVLVFMQPWKLHIDSVRVAERISLQRKG